MKSIAKWIALAALSLTLFAGAIDRCVDNGGIYVPEKGCLIEARAVCGIDTEANSNTTVYGWAKIIPTFANGYAELGEFNVSNIVYTAKVDASCRQMTDIEIEYTDMVKLIARQSFTKKGTFIHYGESAFEWAYIPNNGGFIAFLKPSEGGFLDYAIVNLNGLGIKVDQNYTSVIIKTVDTHE